MPVRRIPTNSRSLTGRLASVKGIGASDFESSLERDFLTLIEFDLDVERFEVQPVRIRYSDPEGKVRFYIPDVLIWYRKDIEPAKKMPPRLCEVKYLKDLDANDRTFASKFNAAHRYAERRKWEFRVITEEGIRTPYLENARFLLPHRCLPWDEPALALLLSGMRKLGKTTPQSLVESIYQDRWARARLLPTLWKMMATELIKADLSVKLTMTSAIWPWYQ